LHALIADGVLVRHVLILQIDLSCYVCFAGYKSYHNIRIANPKFIQAQFASNYIFTQSAIMAAAAVQQAPGNTFGQVVEPLVQQSKVTKHDIANELYYYQEPADGSPPAPTYVG
jgi:hypothetical protein